jgi:FkbM family methyltransferase
MTNFYEGIRYEYNLAPESWVMDVGGYDGTFAAEIARRYGCSVVVFEPVQEFRENVILRLKHNPKIYVMSNAVGGSDRKMEIGVKGNMSGEFTFDRNRTEPAHMLGILGVLQGLFHGGCDLMKLNCEGSEFEILEALVGTPEISRVRNIQVQWHPVVPDAKARFEKLQARLSETHRLSWNFGWTWQNWELKP